MSGALSSCSSFAAAPAPRAHPAAASSILLVGASAALAAIVSIAMLRPASAPAMGNAPYAAATLVAGQGVSPDALLDTAEAMRARLLQVSGVGSVSLRGLQTGGVEVDYAPARLARFGLTPADLRAALPVQVGGSARGRLAIRQEAAQSGPQPIADLPVRAGGHALRIGDVATVARTPLASPVATLKRDGGTAVELLVTPSAGADTALPRRVAAELAQAPASDGIRLR